jgi:hypothetical protein
MMFIRHNVTQECLGDITGISQATISRYICRLTPLIGERLRRAPPQVSERRGDP